MHNELMCAIWKCPTIFLHQGNKGESKQFLLSFLLCCRRGEKKKNQLFQCMLTHCVQTHRFGDMSDHEEIEHCPPLTPHTHPHPLYNEEQLLWWDFCLQWPPSNPIVLPHNHKLYSLTNFLQGIHYLKLCVLFVFWSCRFPVSSPHNPTSTPSHKHHRGQDTCLLYFTLCLVSQRMPRT